MIPSSEFYPIIIQVVGPHLMAISPDFDVWVAERYDSNEVGQEVLLIRRLRAKIDRIIKSLEESGSEVPPPTKPKNIELSLPESFLSASEAAKILQVSRQTLWRLERSGKIQAVKTPGGHRRFKKSDIESLFF